MTTKAYILIQTGAGKQRVVVDAVRSLPGVLAVDSVTGPYDNIVVLEAPDLNEVGDLVTNRIHTVDGILHTVTCLVQTVTPST
jgi:DNA-binding Lrp family transcriptional regulator